MSGVSLFCEITANLPASRVKRLDASLAEWGGIAAVYVLVWPDYLPPLENHPKRNRDHFERWRAEAGVPVWGWFNCRADQAADAAKLAELDFELEPDGWKLDIEGEWVKGAKLDVLCKGATATGKPVSASLAAKTASHVEYDYRALDLAGIDIDWQAYFDSGEGSTPAIAVEELYRSSFVITGWQYRHRLASVYGWGKVRGVAGEELASFDSYMRPGGRNAVFGVLPREWGNTVEDRILWNPSAEESPVGLLMGRAPYSRIGVTLDVTRTALLRKPEAWVPIAASARVPGAKKRPVSIYLGEIASDDVIAAIAQGAAP